MPVSKTVMFSADAQINITSTTLKCCLCSRARVESICTVPMRYFVSPILLPANLTGVVTPLPFLWEVGTNILQTKWGLLSLSSNSGLLCPPGVNHLQNQILPKCQEVSLSLTSRVVVDKMPLNDICIISRKLQPFDNAPHVPSHLLSSFTNSCHLVICINCPHVCIVAFNNLVGWDFCQNILPSASCPLLPQNCRCFVRTVNSGKKVDNFVVFPSHCNNSIKNSEVGKLPWQGQMP